MASFGITVRQNSGLRNEVEKKLYLSDIVNYQKRLSILEKMVNIETKKKAKQNEKIQEVC